MFFIGLDDGGNVGPFETLDEALLTDVTAMAIYSLPEYRVRAERLRGLHDGNTDEGQELWEQAASRLVSEVDHMIVEINLVVGKPLNLATPADEAELVMHLMGEGAKMSRPTDYIDAAWVSYYNEQASGRG